MQSARWSRQTALRRLLWYLCVAYSVSFSFSNTIFSSISGSVNKKKNYKQLSALCVMQLHIFFIPKSLTLIFLTKENQEQQVADSSRYISVYKQSCWCNMFTFLSDKHRADLIPPPGGVYAILASGSRSDVGERRPRRHRFWNKWTSCSTLPSCHLWIPAARQSPRTAHESTTKN